MEPLRLTDVCEAGSSGRDTVWRPPELRSACEASLLFSSPRLKAPGRLLEMGVKTIEKCGKDDTPG